MQKFSILRHGRRRTLPASCLLTIRMMFMPFPVSTAGAGLRGEVAFKIYQTFEHSPQLCKAFNAGGGGGDLSSMLNAQMEGTLGVWNIRADYARFKKEHVRHHPVRSYTLNIGMGCKTHTAAATLPSL